MIQFKTYPIQFHLLTNEILITFINKFWDDIFTDIKENNHLMLMCKVQFTNIPKDEIGDTLDSGYRTLGPLTKVNYSEKELFINFLSENIALLNDSYHSQPISQIVFSYIIKEGLAPDSDRRLLQEISDKTLVTHRFNNLNLPISMDPRDYGTVLVLNNFIFENDQWIYRSIVRSGTRIFTIDISKDLMTNKVRIEGAVALEWTDTRLSNDLEDSYTFKREIRKSTIYFMAGEIVLRKQHLPAKPFRMMAKDRKLTNNFYTLDIETINQNGKLIPYLICAYDGTNYITSYTKDQKSLFSSFFDQLLSKIKLGSSIQVYAHNLSGFDGIFMLRHLLSLGKVEPLIFNGKLMSIKIRLSNKLANGKYYGKTITFKDSYLLLPLSLRNLCSAFNVLQSKSYFPFKLNNIFYTGILPKLALWVGISISEYELLLTKFTGKVWSFQDEAIKYCKLDCQSLHQVLTKFNELIFNLFQINIHNSITLPSLAMKVFRTHYLVKDTIYQILGKVESAIRESYTGGAVDVYIPHNRIGSLSLPVKGMFRKLFYYDVNSLYPTVMALHPMPIGKPIFFDGDIRTFEPNAFGFFYCQITSPDNLLHPLLQRRIKTSEGIRTIAGLGSWTGWISSVEMDNAIKYGYSFKILHGYQFEQGDLFSGYINKMYNLRMEYAKGTPMNLIAKLLMNSLYGKFGMRLDITKVEVFDCSTDEGLSLLDKAIDTYGEGIENSIKIDNSMIIVRDSLIDLPYNKDEEMYHGTNVNIAIASTITSAARVFMSIFKNRSNFNLYYSDTDSIVIDKPLSSEIVGNELGQLKLECTIDRAVFLAPKVYGLITEGGDEVIKVKGITHDVASTLTINDLEQLLVKDSSKVFTQDKWYKKVIEGQITVSDIAYTLKVTSNKRSPIYVDGIFQDTQPYHYNEIINK
jgi:hypothetical protein